ncbi:MAG: Fe-S cluster assembly protein SufD [Chromatiales bacterium]|nr:MAG: Fe-S cluster assembly protein SufD [Chromatiales bacterium]
MSIARIEQACAALPDDWLRPARDIGIARFAANGFPSTRHEDWKYTDLAPVAERTLAYLANPPPAQPAPVEPLQDHGDSMRVLFVNGRLAPGQRLPVAEGLSLVALADADAAGRARILDRLQALRADPAADLAALNAAFISGGLLIEIAAGARIERPLEILLQADGQPVAAQPRLVISAGANSQVTLIEQYAGTGAGLTNAVTDLHCGPGAQVSYTKLQAESPDTHHVALQRLVLERDSRVQVVQLDLGARLSRNDLQVELGAPGAEVSIHGLFVADGTAHVDNHTRLDHLAPHTLSSEIYRGIAANQGRGVFNGKIVVHDGADGTDADLNNRNLLLSQRAEIDTKPELEIYADDVKCAHGATTGQLDANALFYLRSRGLAEAQARSMLVNAFAKEILERIPLPRLRETVQQGLELRLARDAEAPA